MPPRIWDLYEGGRSDEPDVSLDRRPDDEDRDLEWWNQQSLTELDLQGNRLRYIEAGLGNLVDLERLNVWRMSHLVCKFFTRPFMQISGNNVSTLPIEIGQLRKLRELKADHNAMKSLPKEVFQLPKLRELDLSHNELEAINAELSDAVMLEKLVRNRDE